MDGSEWRDVYQLKRFNAGNSLKLFSVGVVCVDFDESYFAKPH